jgi:hydrogenase nickel incorporation protein HypA/HybF
MHEFSLAESTLEIAFSQARNQGAARIHRLTMRIGALSGVVPEALEFALQSLSEGTPAEGAGLVIEPVPLTCYCSHCQKDFEAQPHSYRCPGCGEQSLEILTGREMDLVSIEVT